MAVKTKSFSIMENQDQTALKIAKAFSILLKRDLTSEQIAEINERNKVYEDENEGCCASHEFCDANEPMSAAFEIIMEREVDTQNTDDCILWGQAWTTAIENQFFTN